MTYLSMYLFKYPNSLIMIPVCFSFVSILSHSFSQNLALLCYRGDTGVTVVVFSAGTVLFVNPKSEVDPFPTVAGSSAVVGVLAFICGENPAIPEMKVMVASIQTNSINLKAYILPLHLHHSIKIVTLCRKYYFILLLS